METYYRIKQAMDERHLKPATLETQLGIGNGTVSNWESSDPKLSSMVKIAKFFNRSIDYLAGLTDSPSGQYGFELTPDEVEIISLLRNPIFSDEDRDYVKFNLKLFFEYKYKISIARDEE